MTHMLMFFEVLPGIIESSWRTRPIARDTNLRISSRWR